MAKETTIATPRATTKRRPTKWEREGRLNALLLLFGAVFLLVILAIPAFGYYQDVIARGNAPVARVNEQTFDMNYYMKLLRFRNSQLERQLAYLQMVGSQGGDSNTAQFAFSQAQILQNQRAILPMQVLEEVIDNQVMRDGAAKIGITASASEIDQRIKEQFTPPADESQEQTDDASQQAAFEANYKAVLDEAGMSDADYRSMVADVDVLREKVSQKLESEVPVRGEQVYLYMIGLVEEDQANDVHKKLEAGRDFSTLARQVSELSSKDAGGDVGWTPRGILDPAIEEAAFKLEPGELSPVINVQGSYVILKVTQRADDRSYTEVQINQLKSNALTKWLDEQKEAHSDQIERFFDSDKQIWAMEKLNRQN